MTTTNQTTALSKPATSDGANLSGTYVDASKVGAVLAEAARKYHLVSPAPACSVLPEGCSVALSTVLINVDAETYSLGGDDGGSARAKLGLSKSALDRIAFALGVSWDPVLSGRLDDRSHPHYVAFKSVGHVRQFDGSTITIAASKEMDLREGSAQLEILRERHQSRIAYWERGGRKGPAPKSPDGQIREMRLHILAHAESKARNRAIRSLGVRTSYTREELAKPFVCAQLVFTGHSDDPELRRAFALKRADRMLDGARALFGPPDPQELAHPAKLSPPVLGVARDFDDDGGEELAAEIEPAAEPAVTTPPQSAPATPARAATPATPPSPQGRSGFKIPGGSLKGVAIEEAPGDTLDYWIRRIGDGLAEGSARYPDRDRPLLEAMRAELECRTGGDDPPDGGEVPGNAA